MLLALSTSIRLGGKGLPGINAQAYYKKLLITVVKSFKTLALKILMKRKQ
jgi:hypothetical protein